MTTDILSVSGRFLVVIASVMLALSLLGCAVPADPDSPATPTPPTPPAPPAPTTVAEPTGERSPMTWVMPDLVGSNLQDAQDAIQEVTDYRIAVTISHDQTGAGRSQVVDRNWKVCSQSVAPGELITRDTLIDFGVVRLGESC